MSLIAEESAAASPGERLLVWALVATALAACFVRLFFGVDLTDEAYYAALASVFANGNLPFRDNWDAHQTSAILYTPLVMAYRAFQGDFSGLILFMRLMFFCYNILFGMLLYCLLRRPLGFKALLLALPLAVFAPYSLYTFSYNSLHYSLATAGCFLVFGATLSSGRRRMALLAAAGAAHGLAVFAYPSALALFILNAAIVLVLFRNLEPQEHCRRGLHAFLAYTLAAAVTLAALLAGLALYVGVPALVQGVQGFLAYNDELYRVLSPRMRWIKIGQLFLLPFTPFFLIKVILIAAWNAVLLKQFKKSKNAFLMYLTGGFLLLIAYVALRLPAGAANGNNLYGLSEFTAFSALAAPWLRFHTVRHRKLFDLLLITVGLPSTALWLESFWVSMARASTCSYLLVAPSLLTAVFIALLVEEHWQPRRPSFSPRRASAAAGLACLAAVSGLFLFLFYGTVYRDGRIWTLTSWLETGLYRGIFTLPARQQALQRLDSTLARIADPSKTVLALDHAPYFYPMSRMRPCTPSCMEVTCTHYGKPLWQPAFLFFGTHGGWPDRIVLLGEDGNKVLEIPGFELGDFIREHYAEIYRDDSEPFRRRVLDRR
ncbi:hypothetical protein LLH00_18480 [bacterium]|nr:hypothetical protein [bacterium]